MHVYNAHRGQLSLHMPNALIEAIAKANTEDAAEQPKRAAA